MLYWDVEPDEVRHVLTGGETIEEYDDGARLMLGRSGVRPLHVVVADTDGHTVVVTVYEPSADRWDASFRLRRPL